MELTRTVEIELMSEMIAITAVLSFDFEDGDFEYLEKETNIIKVVNLEGNEGNLMPIKDRHFNLVTKHFEENNVYEEL